MTNKECIIAEIKRLLNEWRFLSSTEAKYRFEAYTELLEWIDSMPKEPVSKDLEEAAVEAFKHIVDSDKNSFLEIFKAGAKWKEKQMMKDTIDATVFCESLKIPTIGHFLHKTNLKENDKVKVIIIKSE